MFSTICGRKAKIKGQLYDVKITVRETADGKNYYHQEVSLKGKPGSAQGVALQAEARRTGFADLPGSGKNIAQPSDLVNPAPKSAGQAGQDQFYINFSRIDAPEDVKTVMQNMADYYRADIETARHGKRTFEQTVLSAEQEDAWRILSERRTGQPLNGVPLPSILILSLNPLILLRMTPSLTWWQHWKGEDNGR